MIKSSSFLFAVIISLLISGVLSTSEETCNTKSNTDCDSCMNITGCAYCVSSKKCFLRPTTMFSDQCGLSDLKMFTCFANAQIFLIIFCAIALVLLIAIVVLICCCRSNCRNRSLRKDKSRQNLNERQLEDRRAAAELRSAERNQKADQIRLKYGLMKGKDTSVQYKPMS